VSRGRHVKVHAVVEVNGPGQERPSGTSTRPPPLVAQAPIAFRIAALQFVTPSGFAP
jgi:hypothetical protein